MTEKILFLADDLIIQMVERKNVEDNYFTKIEEEIENLNSTDKMILYKQKALF